MAAKKNEREYLSPIQLGRLLPIIPSVLSLLKELSPTAADLFLEGEEADRKTINYLMTDLLNQISFNGDLSMLELRFSFASYKTAVWLGLLREVLTGCWPRIVPDKVAAAMLGSLGQLNEAQSPSECSYVLGPLLDRIPRMRFRVLGEFCAFLRETSNSPEDMASLTGPFLLVPSNVLTTQGTNLIASQTAASAAIMDMLITECEMLFGRVAALAPVGYPLGKRPALTKAKTAPDTPGPTGGHRRSLSGTIMQRLSLSKGSSKTPPAPPGLGTVPVSSPVNGKGRAAPPPPPRSAGSAAGPTSPKDTGALTEKRKKGLRVFYQWRDPRRVEGVDALFSNYEFEEIALAIQRKYFGLPPGWHEQLEYMQLSGSRNLGWFARLKQGVLPAPVEASFNASEGSKAPQEETKVDKVINEIADTEMKFNKAMSSLQDQYAMKIKAIADGLQGSAAAKALGLSSEQVEHIFGARLAKIVDVSNNLISDLEVVTLVRMQPKGGKSRIELVSRIFMDASDQLRVFGPFAAGHKTAATYLRKANEDLGLNQDTGPRKGGMLRMGSFFSSESNKNYLELWQEIAGDNDALRGQTIESVLIMPVQRVPRYRLLLQELLKATPESDPSFTMLAEVCEVIKGLATDINEAIRAHERLMKKFGDDANIPHNTQYM